MWHSPEPNAVREHQPRTLVSVSHGVCCCHRRSTPGTLHRAQFVGVGGQARQVCSFECRIRPHKSQAMRLLTVQEASRLDWVQCTLILALATTAAHGKLIVACWICLNAYTECWMPKEDIIISPWFYSTTRQCFDMSEIERYDQTIFRT
jgi:hypothetical protein